MRRLEKIIAWFLIGGAFGSAIGMLGGIMDRGSMMIMLPSGNPFWAIVGAFLGCIAGALWGAFSRLSPPKAQFITPEGIRKKGRTV